MSDLDSLARARLSAWLHAALPQLDPLEDIERFSGGQSNPTYGVRCRQRTVVLRRRPFGRLLPKAHMIEREYAVMLALNGCRPQKFDLGSEMALACNCGMIMAC